MDDETKAILRSIRTAIWTLVVIVTVLGVMFVAKERAVLRDFIGVALGIGILIAVVFTLAHILSSALAVIVRWRRQKKDMEKPPERSVE